MKRVLDSSVGFKWFVPELHSDKALCLRDDYRNGIVELIAPDIFLVEITHALTRAERQKRITSAQGALALANMMNMQPQLSGYIPLLPRAYQISSHRNVGVYDCLYLALAEREGCDLVTSDDRLLKNLQPHFPFLISLASLP
ncbi:MAG TPA: type II toxin-antitoxin system VapC family toxin [Gemmataceae bacterium]|nr:type II toxin-antitoxin system VapC family toxin [Gemmataceae bacterium]